MISIVKILELIEAEIKIIREDEENLDKDAQELALWRLREKVRQEFC